MLRAIFNFLIAWLVLFASIGFCLWQLVSPNFIGTQAKNVGLYNKVANDLPSVLPSSNLNGITLTSTDITSIATSSVDANTFYDFFNQLTNAYSQWLVGRTSLVNFSYSTVTVKNNLMNNLTANLETKYQALPTCTTAQLKKWQATTGLPSCQLPESNSYSSQVNTLLSAQASQVVNQLPDTLRTSNSSQGFLSTRNYATKTLQIIELIWAITAVLVVLYLIVFRTRAFFSLSFIFILAGVLEVAFSFVGWDWLTNIVTSSLKSINQTTASVVVDLSGAGLNALKTTLGDLSIVSLSLGAFFLIAGIFTKFMPNKNNGSLN